MRNLVANNRKLWYSLYLGETDVIDENGDFTGERTQHFSEPVMFKANLSATRGTQGFTGTGGTYDYFGADIDYSLIISTADMHLPIDEHSLVWDVEPERDPETGEVDFDKARFTVTAVARSLVQMKYAIKRKPATEVKTWAP